LLARSRRVTLTGAMRSRSHVTALLATAMLLGMPVAAGARDGGGGDGVRAAGTCGGSARSEIKLKADDGAIEAEFEVHQARGGSGWRVVIVQEGRVVWRGTAHTARATGAFTLARRLRDLPGADRVSIRAAASRGVTCRASATLPGA
jgi:hypothetical protein